MVFSRLFKGKKKEAKKDDPHNFFVGELQNSPMPDGITLNTLGIEIINGVFPFVAKGATLPVVHEQFFSTANDNQTEISLHLLQGESTIASENTSLGKFAITGIPREYKGVPKIKVSFLIFEDGSVYIKAFLEVSITGRFFSGGHFLKILRET